MRKYGVGILGFGTIGAGVVEGLQRNGSLMASRAGLELEVNMVADLDLKSDRGVVLPPGRLVSDAKAVIDSPGTHIVVELIGGTKVARELILRALRLGKPVVTANKALLAEHGAEIYQTAFEHNTDVFYEGSVGGGIPIIRTLREGLVANHIDSIHGILNGTCNYILTTMEEENRPFEEVLKDAQAAGYAEANPALDIDGIDTAHKTAILASLAYGRQIPLNKVRVRGIRGLDPADMRYAAELGYRIKLLGVIKHQDDAIEVGVQPTLVPMDHMLASVNGVFNAIVIDGDIVGETLYYGRGAGRLPTASAVLGDIVDAARNLEFESYQRVPPFVEHEHYAEWREEEDVVTRYYMRCQLLDKPGVIARVAGILGDQDISISSVIQKEKMGREHAPVIFLTHRATVRQFWAACAAIDALPEVAAPTIRYRIEDFSD